MADTQYDNIASSDHATISRDGGLSRALITTVATGNITYDSVASSDHATVTGSDGKNHRAMLVINVNGATAVSEMTTPTGAGTIVQYTGETDETYHRGYFYESIKTGTTPSSATISQTVGEGLESLAVNKTTFETQITESGTYNFTALLNREHIIATIGEESVRMDRDEAHDVEGAIAWTPDGETYFYTEELVPDVADEVFADPDGETVAGAVAEYNAEAIGWIFNGEFVDLEDYGISYTPADPEATVEYASEALGTATVDSATFATQVAESDLYIFDCMVVPERILATVGEAMIQYNRDAESDTETLFGWKDENANIVYTDSATPSATDSIYSDTEETVAGTIDAYQASSTTWYRGADMVDLTDYGIAYTGTAEDGNTIHIDFVGVPPHQDDVITVVYTAEADVFGWQRINVQPSGGGGGGGSVNSVNSQEPDDDGNVLLNGTHIKATVGGTQDTIQNHLGSLRNDLGDLGDDVSDLSADVTALETKTETLSTASKQVKDNTIYTGSTLSSVTLTFPVVTATYVAKVNFKSGATATTFTVPDTVVMVNDDCSGGVFVPVANKTYSIMFHYNGTSIVGIVQGV